MGILKWLAKIMVIALLSVMVVGSAFTVGYGVGFLSASPSMARPAAPPGKDFSLFWEAWSIIERDFYGEIPEFREVVYGAIRGAVGTLKDPYTGFLDPKQAAIERENMTGSFEGIGAVVDMRNGRLVIVEVMEGQPAEKAGLKSGDIVLEVDGVPIEGMSLIEAVSLIRGPKGTPVTLTILREGEPAPFEVTIIRERIELPTVKYEMMDGVAYIKLREFNDVAADRVHQALQELLAQNPKGIIFDLRGNPGGWLIAAVRIAGEFLPEGKVVLVERRKDGSEEVYKAEAGGLATDPDLPLVILVNGRTASASEIVAGAVQDHDRGVLVGEKTLGKGSVQYPYTLSDGSELRVTVARWFTPSGRQIHGKGIEPDIEVPITEEDIQAGRDPQLDKALELIKGR